MKRSEKARISGYIMAACGFIFILITVLNFIFNWRTGIPPGVIGIVFLAVGMAWIRRSRQIRDEE